MDENYTVILFPEFVTLKAEVEKLRTEISMLFIVIFTQSKKGS